MASKTIETENRRVTTEQNIGGELEGRWINTLKNRSMVLGGRNFLLSPKSNRTFIDTLNYVRIPGRTDNFILYNSIHNTNKNDEIALFTPYTLLQYHSNSIYDLVARKVRPWEYDEILNNNTLKSINLPSSLKFNIPKIQKILGYDKLTEGDSLRFFNFISQSDIEISSEFWPVLLLWLRDEINHHNGFETVYFHLFGYDPELEEAIDSEESNFQQFDSIVQDPFKLLVALSYDEAATINGYKHDFPVYESIGKPMVEFIQRVSADEGWHFLKFARLAAEHSHGRINEIDSILDEVTKADGRKYRRTFFLDHDPSVEEQFTEKAKKEARDIAKKVILNKINEKYSLM
ncbi:MAG: hypothetical protein KC440_06885 [Nitrosarchaeum sp.]|nr:hypothetical protein [Nitrosarchaeum sp.]